MEPDVERVAAAIAAMALGSASERRRRSSPDVGVAVGSRLSGGRRRRCSARRVRRAPPRPAARRSRANRRPHRAPSTAASPPVVPGGRLGRRSLGLRRRAPSVASNRRRWSVEETALLRDLAPVEVDQQLAARHRRHGHAGRRGGHQAPLYRALRSHRRPCSESHSRIRTGASSLRRPSAARPSASASP